MCIDLPPPPFNSTQSHLTYHTQLKYQDTATALQEQRVPPKSSQGLRSSGNNNSILGNNNNNSHSHSHNNGSSSGVSGVSGGRNVVVKLAEAEAKVDQLTRALAKKGQYMESRIKVKSSSSSSILYTLVL
jgi:hypothetical protein